MRTSLSYLVPAAACDPPRSKAVTAERCTSVTRTTALVILSSSLAYAILRYVLLGDVAPRHIPLFILDKAVAVTGAALLAATLTLTPLMRLVPRLKPWGRLRKTFGLCGFAFAALHVALTMTLLGPAYHGKLHLEDGRFSLQGELALLLGIASFSALLFPAITSLGAVKHELLPRTWTRLQRMSILAFALTGGHLAALGIPSWLAPESWAGGLPPITLLAIVMVGAVFVLRVAMRRR